MESRIESILTNMINDETETIRPQSRIEVLLSQLAEKIGNIDQSLTRYRGRVDSVADLPAAGEKAGDWYFVGLVTDTTMSEYAWNGTSWDPIGSSEITVSGLVSYAESQSLRDSEKLTARNNIGLGNVDNTADADKPISTATQTALNGKADAATTYTKIEVDTALSAKADEDTAIQGIKVNNTTINPDANKVINITVPTTAADVSALPDTTKYATALSLTINASTFVITGQLKDQNGNNLGTVQTIDLPLESVVVGGSYNSQTKKVVLTLQNGNAIEFSVADLVSGLQTELSTEQLAAVNSGITSTDVEQITENKNDISSIQQEQIVQNADIATLRLALDAKIYGIRIDKQDVNPDTRVTYLYDAVGMTPAYMDFNSGTFNYGSWADIWFVKNNRPVALKFDGTVDYELDHTDFTKKLDGTASDVEDSTYAGNFMSEMPTVYVKRWEDSRYNYIAFSDNQVNSDFLAQAHTNANGTVNDAVYLPMFKGWKDSNNKFRSLMGTYPTGNTTGTNEVTYAGNCGTGWQLWDKAKIDLIMDLIMLITKSTNCRAKIGTGDCQTYNASDTTNYGKMKSGYETDGTTRSTNAQFYGSEGTEVTNYGKHHMIAFYIEDLWANRWDRCLGFNLVDNVYKVKMTAPYVLDVLDSDSSYETLTVAPPSTGGWLKNVSSANAYGDVPTEAGASNTTGFANYFYKHASGGRLSLFGGRCDDGLQVGRCWSLDRESGSSVWAFGGSPCYNSAT